MGVLVVGRSLSGRLRGTTLSRQPFLPSEHKKGPQHHCESAEAEIDPSNGSWNGTAYRGREPTAAHYHGL